MGRWEFFSENITSLLQLHNLLLLFVLPTMALICHHSHIQHSMWDLD